MELTLENWKTDYAFRRDADGLTQVYRVRGEQEEMPPLDFISKLLTLQRQATIAKLYDKLWKDVDELHASLQKIPTAKDKGQAETIAHGRLLELKQKILSNYSPSQESKEDE
jgi:hypothetical protein